MLRREVQAARLVARIHSDAARLDFRVPIKAIATLRKRTDVTISKAREALLVSNNDVDAALRWLDDDLAVSGAKTAAKVGSRPTGEGLISIALLADGARPSLAPGAGGVRASMVELNCETDFVARNAIFSTLAADIAHTAAFLHEATGNATFTPYILEDLLSAPLLSPSVANASSLTSVGDSIRNTIAKLGENISMRRAMAVVQQPPASRLDIAYRLTSYVHGSVGQPTQGRIATLALLTLSSKNLSERMASAAFCDDLGRLERAVARQIVAFDAKCVRPSAENSPALYNQMFETSNYEPSGTVEQVLHHWSKEQSLPAEGALGVLDFAKWVLGEPLDSSTA